VVFDMRTIHQDWHTMRTETAAWQESIHKNAEVLKDGMERLHGAAIVRDEYVDKAFDKQQARLDRQRRDLSDNYQRIVELREANRQLREELQEQKVLIESMSDRLCNCRSVPIPDRSSGRSSGLSYAGSDEYRTPPVSTPPRENNTPLPVVVAESDLENVDPNDVVPIYASTHENVAAALAEDRLIETLRVRRNTRLQRAIKSTPFRRDRNPHTIRVGVPVDRRGIGYHLESERRRRRNTRGACRGIDPGYASDSESGSDGAGSSSDRDSVDGEGSDESAGWPLSRHSGMSYRGAIRNGVVVASGLVGSNVGKAELVGGREPLVPIDDGQGRVSGVKCSLC
jgi:hypothetical protein